VTALWTWLTAHRRALLALAAVVGGVCSDPDFLHLLPGWASHAVALLGAFALATSREIKAVGSDA
jgi:hypothetical protein